MTPLLNEADALYVGENAVDAAYYGAEAVWPAVTLLPRYDNLILNGDGDAEVATTRHFLKEGFALVEADPESADWAAHGNRSFHIEATALQLGILGSFGDFVGGLIAMEPGWHYIRFNCRIDSFSNLQRINLEGDFYATTDGGSWIDGTYNRNGMWEEATMGSHPHTIAIAEGEFVCEGWFEAPATTAYMDWYISLDNAGGGATFDADVFVDDIIIAPTTAENVVPDVSDPLVLRDDFNRADHAEPLGDGWGADSLWGGLAVESNAADSPDATGGQMWDTVFSAPVAAAVKLLNGSNWFYMSVNEDTPPAPGAGGFELEIQPAPDHIWTLYQNTGVAPDFPHYGEEFGVEQVVSAGDGVAVSFDGREAAAWWRAGDTGPWTKVTSFNPPGAADWQAGRVAIFTSDGYPVDNFRAGEGSLEE